jgi:hypothetical protein
MSKSQNRRIRNMKSQGNMSPQKVNNHTTKYLTDSEVDETSISELKKVKITIMKEDMP